MNLLFMFMYPDSLVARPFHIERFDLCYSNINHMHVIYISVHECIVYILCINQQSVYLDPQPNIGEPFLQRIEK